MCPFSIYLSFVSLGRVHCLATGTVYFFTGCSQQYYKEPLEETPYWSKSTKSFRELNRKELEEAGARRNTVYGYGFEFDTIIAESPKFLRWMENQIRDLGGQFAPRQLQSFSHAIEVAIESGFLSRREVKHAIVLNCSGYGAKFLCDDDNVVPVRGQVLRVFAPQVQEFKIDVDKKGMSSGTLFLFWYL